MKGKLRATLDLVRLPNVITAMADVLAGFLFMGGKSEQWLLALCLIGASSCLYAGGVTLNDVCDVQRDAIDRPNRPIPSGIISKQYAATIAITLLVIGIILSIFAGQQSAWIAMSIVVSIVLYNAVFKLTFIAPGLMGLCRALNLLLGMSTVPLMFTSTTMIPVGLMWLYITSVTTFARRETQSNNRMRLILSTAGACAGIAGLASLYWMLETVHAEFIVLVAIMLVWISARGVSACVHRKPQPIQAAVKTMILGLIFFDAAIVWSTRGHEAAILVAAFIIPSFLLSRFFRVT